MKRLAAGRCKREMEIVGGGVGGKGGWRRGKSGGGEGC